MEADLEVEVEFILVKVLCHLLQITAGRLYHNFILTFQDFIVILIGEIFATVFSLFIFRPGSANSLAKSMNGSIKSDTLSAGSGGTTGDDGLGMDGDNINVVVRVRPLNPKELKSGDQTILTFPGDGGIWVS